MASGPPFRRPPGHRGAVLELRAPAVVAAVAVHHVVGEVPVTGLRLGHHVPDRLLFPAAVTVPAVLAPAEHQPVDLPLTVAHHARLAHRAPASSASRAASSSRQYSSVGPSHPAGAGNRCRYRLRHIRAAGSDLEMTPWSTASRRLSIGRGGVTGPTVTGSSPGEIAGASGCCNTYGIPKGGEVTSPARARSHASCSVIHVVCTSC